MADISGAMKKGMAEFNKKRAVAASEFDELLPCPFCGEKAELEGQYLNGKYVEWVQCRNRECGASAKPEAWNRRAR